MLIQKISSDRAGQPIRVRSASTVSGSCLADALALMGASMRFERNAEIYGEGEPSDYVYKISRARSGLTSSSMTAAARSARFI